MNRPEIIKLVTLLSANYRNWPADGKEEDTVMLWETMLKDIPFDVGQAAVKAHMSKSVYPPTIADIRSATVTITQPDSMSAIEAWDLIGKAIRQFGFYRESEAMEFLPAGVERMAKNFGWRELCLSENIDTLRAQFRMAWETQQKRDREERIMPPEVKQLIGASGIIKRLE